MRNKSKFDKLFEPCQIRKMALKNRIVMPAMSTKYASEDGDVTQQMMDYYEERAKGGAGLIIVEMACVDAPTGKMGSRHLIFDKDGYIQGLSELAQVIRKQGPKVMLQLCHGGRIARSAITGVQPVAPSAVIVEGQETPRELTVDEIESIVTYFAEASRRAQKAGFDGVEVHAAHGYLLAQFLSSAWNKRKDDFGGSLRNRARILLRIMVETKSLVGQDYPVWCRINGMEYGIEGGMTIDEAKEVAQIAQEGGADAIHVSAYGYASYAGINRACIGFPRGNLVRLAAEIKKVVSIPVVAVGRIDLQLGEELLREKKVDLVAIGRPQIADPHLIRKTIEGKMDDITPCIACNHCVDDMMTLDISLRCSVNACVGREREYKITPAQKTKRVLVVGGGPSGMEAARVAALRGHEVILFEKQSELGGQLILAVKPPRKDEIQLFTNYLAVQVKKLGVKFEIGKEADVTSIKKINPDAVILATGVTSLIPEIPGIDHRSVITAEEVLSGKRTGKRVIIIGGGLVGCETAEFLAERGKTVKIVEMLNEVAEGVCISVKVGLIQRLKASGVAMLTGLKCDEITQKGMIIATGKGGKRQTIEADTVVLAAGAKPNIDLLQALEGVVSELHLVGDCAKPGRILQAISDGYRIGLSL
jgi:2,4-dienoyl-CoA reductase-like NADH-dependent reductase (Old Yellow Enzyme family)/thioredoxin reductase